MGNTQMKLQRLSENAKSIADRVMQAMEKGIDVKLIEMMRKVQATADRKLAREVRRAKYIPGGLKPTVRGTFVKNPKIADDMNQRFEKWHSKFCVE